MVAESRCNVGPPPLTRIVKILLMLNAAAFVSMHLARRFVDDETLRSVCLVPDMVVHSLALWQLVTSTFVHFALWHLACNMIALYLFGPSLERRFGSGYFLRLYLVSGVAGSVCTVILSYVLAGADPVRYAVMPFVQVIGASGAIFGLLVVYAACFPEQVFLVMFVVPMRARTMAILFIAIDAFMLISGSDTGVAYTAHLGGALGGWLYYRATSKRPPGKGRESARDREARVVEGRFRAIMRDAKD